MFVIIIDNNNGWKVMKIQLQYGIGINDLKEIDFVALAPIILPVVAVVLIIIIIALIDLYRNKNRRENVWLWTFAILLVIPLGPILYFIIGRKDRNKNGNGN